MEKGMEKQSAQTSIFVITGPESTGKTELAKALANQFSCNWEPESARDYVQKLNGKYTYADVEIIAKKQIQQFEQAIKSNEMCFFDTGLIITKVWFDIVYNRCPTWLIEAINRLPQFVHLLCNTDLPWQADSVRENGGEMRQKLFEIYQVELNAFGFPYYIISGKGSERINSAIKSLHKHLDLDSE